jgi:SAM-dependent methyltransferase
VKVRDSGMPEEVYWETLVDVPLTVERFGFSRYRDVVEMGCGYGTFSESVARSISGMLYAYDIDPEMIQRTKLRVTDLPIVVEKRDVFVDGFKSEVDAVMLFNILHCEAPEQLLRLASAAAPKILVTHWKYTSTPRGPKHSIRPRPEAIGQWATNCGLFVTDSFELPPWHFGMVLSRA